MYGENITISMITFLRESIVQEYRLNVLDGRENHVQRI